MKVYYNREAITINRDEWGVPHIYADSESGALFGQGYAMAEDRLPTILRAYRKALGRMAEVHGEMWIEHDFKQHLFQHQDAAARCYAKSSPTSQLATQAFVSGIRSYIDKYPEELTEDYIEIEPYFPIMLGRYSCWDVLLDQAKSDLFGEEQKASFGNTRGSNAWAVSNKLTKDDSVILHLDPHVPWSEDWIWHEAHLHGGSLRAYGFSRPGAPYFFFGHNEHIGWTITMGAGDNADVYRLTLNDATNPTHYLFDDQRLPLRIEKHEVILKEGNTSKSIVKNHHYSHHGPIIHQNGTEAFALREAYGDDFENIAVWREINLSKNLGEFQAALRECSFSPFNLLYGDVEGNIFYIRAGRVPKRATGYDYMKPIPGDTSKTEWLGVHSIEELPQVLNPECGWFQNCNISPESVYLNSHMNEDHYASYLIHGKKNDMYMSFPSGNTPRGSRAFHLLSNANQLDYENALDIVNDCYMHEAIQWVKVIVRAYEQLKSKYVALDESIEILKKWDYYANKESVGNTIFSFWWKFIQKTWGKEVNHNIWQCIRNGLEIEESHKLEFLNSLEETVNHLTKYFGHIQVPWKEVFVAKRGEETWPVNGNTFFPLRIFSGSRIDNKGRIVIDFGQTCPTLVFLKKGNVRSFSALSYGISEDSNSPHYTDQGRLLISENKLKDTNFGRKPPTLFE